jgi:solute carrier family 13 (sodium-dependent dicarboxylate transporter), member 2/3/5
MTEAQPANPSETSPLARKIGYFLGPALFLLTFFVDVPDGMSAAGWRVSGLALWMATWWITEAMPLPVTSLLPVVILPVDHILPLKSTLTSFSSPIIFLFLGGFLLSLAMEKWNLHMRIGLGILHSIGVGGKSILAGIMLATAFLGMWISNTATVIMMLPMAISIALLLSAKNNAGELPPLGQNALAKAMIFGVAYAAVIGGLSTFVGTPTNAVLQSYMVKTYNHGFNLADWMCFGVPLSLLLLGLTWWLLVVRYIRHAAICEDVRLSVREAFSKLGPMCREEKIVLFVFVTMALLWVFSHPLSKATGLEIEDAMVAVFGGMLLFLIPTDFTFSKFALTWKDTTKLPWGILVFFGGSLALSDALSETGVIHWLSVQMEAIQGLNIVLVVTLVMLMVIAVSEFMSNVATVTAFTPILAALAAAMEVNPLIILIPATLAASTAFALPGASAANALAYGTGHVKVRDIIQTGFLLNIISLVLILLCTFSLVLTAMDIDIHTVPEWASLTKS